jgi:hypothetical protein
MQILWLRARAAEAIGRHETTAGQSLAVAAVGVERLFLLPASLTCSYCEKDIAPDASRSVADDDSVWCADCYETADHVGERPAPTVPRGS